MKVVQILHELKFSGAEIMYVDAAPFFREKGCDLTVMATAPVVGEYSVHFENAGYKVVHNPYPARRNYLSRLLYWASFTSFIKKEKFDVIHIHTSAIMWEIAFCSWLAGIRSVFTFHSVFTSHFYSYPLHLIQRWTAKKIFGCKFQSISDSVYEHELEKYHNNTIKINNWYGLNRFYPAGIEEKKQVRRELNIPEEALVLISIGECSPIKRHSDIIMALPRICLSHPSVLYLHLGKGDMEEVEIELAAGLGVRNNVRFCGNRKEVRMFLVAADIYVMTSKYEGISITTIEAMACGVPAILYDVAGLCDFNKTGKNCMLIAEDYNLLAETVIYLYTHPELSQLLSHRALELVNNSYNLNKNASGIYQLYSN
ncbi:glycosyltransferase family 4 protein [Proteiniphilum sp. UBA5510]|jgi:glycosyltransferase involved in cell wall biosynthesis|uniref:glycosyltransferase family 4 protein n=1 Tax=Proteiniphilum sp. UBA5510 TaxID=1947286 RepID=UPI00257B9091|nr:glycosyltransferase family 4 protein [Proteiniphilum sp. UBA5510]